MKISQKLFKEVFFFGITGLAAFIVDATITSLLTPIAGVYVSRAPAFLVAVIVTWIINRRITFKERLVTHNIWAEFCHYLSLMILGAVVNYTVYAVSISFIKVAHAIILCVALGSIAGMTINFITSRKYIYKSKIGDSGEGIELVHRDHD